ncbi:hypothetical protein FRC10_010689 [Ceratobasidium sp. 414]|nr:hypothetical protein FRC10_010689 [Ceratobasidium sp. 414]
MAPIALSSKKIRSNLLRAVLLPEVSALPENLTDEQKAFWNQLVGDPFRARLGKRGKKSANGRTWTHDQFVGPFCDELYPKLSEEAREQYELLLGPKAYAYLTNHTRVGGEGVKPKPAVVSKQRIYGHDVWRQENPEVFDEMMKEYEAENPGLELNVGTRRSLTIEFFGRLPELERTKYREIAVERLKTIRTLGPLNGDAKAQYISRFITQWEAMVKEADRVAGIKVNSQLLYQDSNDDYNIRTIVTQSMGELEDTQEVDRMVSWIKQWVQARTMQSVKFEDPRPTVFGDPTRDNFPHIPSIIGLRLSQLQKILRAYFAALWAYQGGYGKVPWELISTDLNTWILPHRRPPGVEFGDPNDLRLAAVLTWLEYFTLCQTGTIPRNQYIQFAKVLAGAHPIDSTLSQESSRRLEITGLNKEQWVLEYTETVTRCHAPGKLTYPDESVEYAQFLARIKTAPAGNPKSLASLDSTAMLLGLPTGRAHPTAVIYGQEKALLIKWCTALPSECSSIILELIDAINGMQSHSPVSTECGIWVGQYADGMPALLPSSPDALLDGLQFFATFWLHRSYFVPRALAEPRSRFRYIHIWIEDMLETELIKHHPTKTLIGSYNGTVWVVRAIILLILNFCAINGELTPPTDQPEDFDISQFPLDEYPNVIIWARQLLSTIQSSTATLAKTSAERQSSNTRAQPQELEPSVEQHQEPVAVPVHPPTSARTTAPPRPKKRRVAAKSSSDPRASRRNKQAGDEQESDEQESDEQESDEIQGGDSDRSSVDKDYDALDVRSDDEDDLNPDGYSLDETGLDRPAGDFRPAHSSPHLGEECFNVFKPGPSPSNDQVHPFGPLPTLPAASLDQLPTSYAPLVTSVMATTAKVESTLRRWDALAETNEVGRSSETRAVREAVADLPGPIRPLAQFVLARRHAWARAIAMAPDVITFIPHIVDHARAVLQLDLAVEGFYATEDRVATIGDPERDELRAQHRRLLKGGIQLCWIYKELYAFEALSARWANSMPSSVLSDNAAFVANGPVLCNDVLKLVAWAMETRELNEHLHKQRKVMWSPIGPTLGTKHNCLLWFCFGNARAEEAPPELDDCLKVIRGLEEDGDESDTGLNASADPACWAFVDPFPPASLPATPPTCLPATAPACPPATPPACPPATPPARLPASPPAPSNGPTVVFIDKVVEHEQHDTPPTQPPRPSPEPSASASAPPTANASSPDTPFEPSQGRTSLKGPTENIPKHATRSATSAAVVEESTIASRIRKGRGSGATTADRGKKKARRK